LFIYLLGFYIFLLSLRCKPLLSIVGAIAFAFASYNLIILEAGHVNKGLVIATMAPRLGGIIMTYRKKYIWGGLVTAIFVGINILWGHPQISYYLILIIIILAVVYFVYALKQKTVKQFFISSAILLVAAILGVAPSIGNLLSTMDYTKYTMRGGSELKQTENSTASSTGLDIKYAFDWSYGRGETMTLLIPNFNGSSSHYNIGENSEIYRLFRSSGQAGQAKQISQQAPMYWGGKPFTSGPNYAGAIVCLLFVLGLIIVKGPEKWWLLGATVLSVFLAWGKNFALFNDFLFYNLPLYNKFRVPETALVMASVTMATLAILVLKQLFDNKEDRKQYLKPLYISAAITGGLCLIFALLGGMLMSFSGNVDERMDPQIVMALISDRKSMLSADAWRSFFFIAIASGFLWFYITNKFKTVYLISIIGILILIDLWNVDRRFLGTDDFVSKRQVEKITPTQADELILQDKDPNYRVFNLTSSPFQESRTSYFHKSVGGYSPTKLQRYQDIIEKYFAQNINVNILNMLNTRYIIVQGQQGGQQVQPNPGALGNVWFVNDIQWVNSPDEEIAALNDFNPSQTAVIDAQWKENIPEWQTLIQTSADSISSIKLKDYVNPGNIIYESKSDQSRLAVFSEVYYKTWHAYIDGAEVPLIRVNYILRGLEVPAGTHTIEFKCIDDIYNRGEKMSVIASGVTGFFILSLLGFAIWSAFRKK
ncbi:MAG: YfhO family protein, partial [Tannerella sp.]|nr:YfhO family protein [Tannerella sp.]